MNLVVVTVEGHPAGGQQRSQDGDVFAQVPQRLLEADAECRHDGGMARADAEPEATGSDLVDHVCLGRDGVRVAGEGLQDRGSQP